MNKDFLTDGCGRNAQYWCDAYCETATAVANQIARFSLCPDTYYAWRPVNPMVNATRKLYEGARYEDGSYDLQMGHLAQTALVWKSGDAS